MFAFAPLLLNRSSAKAFATQRFFATAAAAGPITSALHQLVATNTIKSDPSQFHLANHLDHLHDALATTDASALSHDQLTVETELNHRSFSTPLARFLAQSKKSLQNQFKSTVRPSPKGLYIHGSVGVGKTMTMDLFFDICQRNQVTTKRKQQRAHFHEFMLDVHARIHAFKKVHPKQDPIPPVALSIAQDSQLLCFDEFQVTDIADAMIMKRLFTLLFDMDVVVVSTSNRPPVSLYEGGLNRSQFLPFIDLLQEKCQVLAMDDVHDYRKDTVVPEHPTNYFHAANGTGTRDGNDTNDARDPARDPAMDPAMDPLEHIFLEAGGDGGSETVPVMMGRKVEVRRSNANCGWFTFNELCAQPLGAADYISLSERYPIVIIEDVPQLGSSYYNEARRFVTLVDSFYEGKCRLVISSRVPMDELFVDFDADEEIGVSMDGDEDVSSTSLQQQASGVVKEVAIQDQQGDEESWVSGEGGSSSSSSTTMIRTKEGNMEWSATGRLGVSLAQLSSVKDVVFSFKRAESRLAEMSGTDWGR